MSGQVYMCPIFEGDGHQLRKVVCGGEFLYNRQMQLREGKIKPVAAFVCVDAVVIYLCRAMRLEGLKSGLNGKII